MRIPRAIIPKEYAVDLKAYLDDTLKVEGTVQIKVQVQEDTSVFKIHLADMNYVEADIKVRAMFFLRQFVYVAFKRR